MSKSLYNHLQTAIPDFTMSCTKDRALVAVFAASDELAAQGRLYEAFELMNKSIKNNFTRICVIQALLFMFQIIDEYSVNTRMLYKTSFIKTAYRDVDEMTCHVKNKPQFHFWAGCLKLCQFRNESHLSLIKKTKSLMKARRHFQFTVEHKPNHIMAPYLLTVCDNAYFDLSGTIPYPEITSSKPEEYYNYAINLHPEYFLAFSFILGKLTFYLQQYYFAQCYLNMVLCCKSKTTVEDNLSRDSLKLLNQIAELKIK